MKFTLCGLSQRGLMELGLDGTDAHLITFIKDFYFSDSMHKAIINDKEFFWLKYDYVLQQLPILGITSKNGLYKRLTKYVDAGLMEKETYRVGGTYSYYRFTSKLFSLMSENIKENDGVSPTGSRGLTKVKRGSDESLEQKIHLLKDKEKKQNKKKDLFNSSLPSFIDKDLWDEYLEFRKRQKWSITDGVISRAIKKLAKLHKEGHDVNAIIEKTIDSTWKGFYAPKNEDKQISDDSAIWEDIERGK